MAMSKFNSRPIWPKWTQTVGNAKADGGEIRAACDTCKLWARVDYDRLIAAKGADYSLINRRTRCPNEGCEGWVKFHFRHGVFRPLFDAEHAMHWMFADDERKRAMVEKPTATEESSVDPDFEIQIGGDGLWLVWAHRSVNLGDPDKVLEKFADVMARRDFGE